MAILDWIKEIPLSAVYKERLVDSEKQVLALEREVIELKTRLSECQENRRALEKQIEQKLIDCHSDSISDVQENILSGFIENERLSPEMIADVLGIKSALASYHLLPYHSKISQSVAYKYHLISIRCERFMQSGYWSDRGVNILYKKNFVIELSVNENQVFWGITQAGREYLFSHGLFG